jgi:hypothetical protein
MVGSAALVSPDRVTFNIGQNSQFLIGVSGSPRPALALSGPLPAGLAFTDKGNGVGVVSGAPITSGEYKLKAVATQAGTTFTQDLVIEVCGPPSIVAVPPIVVREGEEFDREILVDGFPVPVLECLSKLPKGLDFSPKTANNPARLHGKLSGSDSLGVAFRATNPHGSPELVVQILIGQTPQIMSTGQIEVKYGSPVSHVITAIGHPVPDISVIHFPDGLSLTDRHDGTAVLSGQLASPGEHSIDIVAGNTFGQVIQKLKTTVRKSPGIVTPDVIYYRPNSKDSFDIKAEGYPVPELTLAAEPEPRGIELSDRGDGIWSISVDDQSTDGDDRKILPAKRIKVIAATDSESFTRALQLMPATPPALEDKDITCQQVRRGYPIQAQGTPSPQLTLPTNPPEFTLTSTGDGQATLKAPDLPAGNYAVTLKAENDQGSTEATLRLHPGLLERLGWKPKAAGARGGGWVKLAVLIILAVLVATAVVIGKHQPRGSVGVTAISYIIATGLLIAAGVLVSLAARNATPPGIQYLFTGTDLRTSTSKTQYLLWTVGVAFALTYVSTRSWLESTPWQCSGGPNTTSYNCIPGGSTWEQYVILLGVPAAAAVVAKGVTSYKVANGTLQKVPADQASGIISLSELTGNDAGQSDLVDIQYLIFNLIAFFYVAVYFVQQGTLVSVPSMLLGLTSTAAAAYTLNKTLQNSKPGITGVTPNTIAPGVDIIITGVNLFPAGNSDSVTVSIAGSGVTGCRGYASGKRGPGSCVLATAPSSLSSSNPTIVVTTAANMTTDPFQINVQSGPVILGWAAPPRPGQTCMLTVSGLPSKPEKHQLLVKVGAFGTVEAKASATKPDVSVTEVSFTLDGKASDTVTVTLIVDGKASQSIDLVIP